MATCYHEVNQSIIMNYVVTSSPAVFVKHSNIWQMATLYHEINQSIIMNFVVN